MYQNLRCNVGIQMAQTQTRQIFKPWKIQIMPTIRFMRAKFFCQPHIPIELTGTLNRIILKVRNNLDRGNHCLQPSNLTFTPTLLHPSHYLGNHC